MMIDDYAIDAIHTFQVRTLRSLGCQTRVILSNRSHLKPEFATDYRVDVTAYGPSHALRLERSDLATLAPGETRTIECAPFTDGSDQDEVLIFRLIPLRLLPEAKNGLVSISRAHLYHLLTIQDQYVEYYRPDGFASGVLYQSGAFNYPKFSRERTTLIQAPKVYVSTTLDTIISVMSSSPDRSHSTPATLRCALIDPQRGVEFVTWSQSIAAFEAASISVKKVLEELAPHHRPGESPHFYCFYGVCDDAALVPLTISHHQGSGALGIEHSLPPTYYALSATGKVRERALKSLLSSRLFSNAPSRSS